MRKAMNKFFIGSLKFVGRRESYRNCYSACNSFYRSHRCSQEMSSSMPDIIQPELPLHQYIWDNVESWHNHTAVVCGISGKKYTYDKLLSNSKKVASSLIMLGLQRGECVSLCLPNIPEFPIAFLGAMEAGLLLHTIHSQTSLEEVQRQLKETNSKCVICHPTNVKIIKQVVDLQNNNIKIICTEGIGGTQVLEHQVIRLEQLLVPNTMDVIQYHTDEDLTRTSLIVYSSGSSGNTKGICLTHKSLTANLEQMLQFSNITQTHGDHQDVIPAIIPFSHAYGQAILMLALKMGAKIVCLPTFKTSLFIKTIIDAENTILFLDTRGVECLANETKINPKYFDGIKEIINGRGLDNLETLEKIRRKTKAIISRTYGLSEMSPIVSWTPREDSSRDRGLSRGILVGSTKCKVICQETKEIQPAYISGEVCVKGPQMMKGYLTETAQMEGGIDPGRWLHTGDTGYYDDLGYLHINGRQEELIRVSGFEVTATELEDVIKKLPGVSEAAVFAAPNKMSGETPVAFVQLEKESSLSEQNIMEYTNSSINKYKHLSSVKIVSEIPKTVNGKIFRSQLINMM